MTVRTDKSWVPVHAIALGTVRENEFALFGTFPKWLVVLPLAWYGFVVSHEKRPEIS